MLIPFKVMLATLIGSRWRDCELRIRPQIKYVALLLHWIFVHSVTLSMIPAKLAMKLRLPVWTKFVKTVDMVLDKVQSLVPEMIQFDGDGLLKMIMNDGISDDKIVRIITDFIIAAGDTVRFLIYHIYRIFCNLLKFNKKNIVRFKANFSTNCNN